MTSCALEVGAHTMELNTWTWFLNSILKEIEAPENENNCIESPRKLVDWEQDRFSTCFTLLMTLFQVSLWVRNYFNRNYK